MKIVAFNCDCGRWVGHRWLTDVIKDGLWFSNVIFTALQVYSRLCTV